MKNELYKKYSSALKEKYNAKVYKIPISLKTTCPVRDGSISSSGCAFCGLKGAGYENYCFEIPIKEQISKNAEFFSKKYKTEKFIIYFQNFTNTYMPLNSFKQAIRESLETNINVAAVAVSTRPDCIERIYLQALKDICFDKGIDVIIELGLQSINPNTLKILNRGHGLSEYIRSVLLIKEFDFLISTHLIISLPWDSREDIIESARLLSILKTNSVKLHTLYIEKNTTFEKMYSEGKIDLLSLEEYISRTVLFLENLSSEISIERLASRVPEDEDILFLNWGRSHWVLQDMIEEKMRYLNTYQGKEFERFNKSLLDKFN